MYNPQAEDEKILKEVFPPVQEATADKQVGQQLQQMTDETKEKMVRDQAVQELNDKITSFNLEKRMSVLEEEYAKLKIEHSKIMDRLKREKAQGKAFFPEEQKKEEKSLKDVYPDLAEMGYV